MLKVSIVLKKLEATRESKLDNLGSYGKNFDAKVNALTTKIETLEATTLKKCNEVYRKARQRIGIPEQWGRRAKLTGERLRRSKTRRSLHGSLPKEGKPSFLWY